MPAQPLRVRFAQRFVFDEHEHQLTFDETEVSLTDQQQKLLLLFLRKPGKLVRRDEIAEVIPGGLDSAEAIRVRMYRLHTLLRNYQDEEYFENQRGVGYRFLAAVGDEPQEMQASVPIHSAEAALKSLGEATAAEVKTAIEEAIAPFWQVTKGFGHRQVRELFKVSLQIAKSFGLDPQPAYRGLWLCSLMGGYYRAALLHAQELERIAQTELDQALASSCVGSTLFYIADFERSITTFTAEGIWNLWEKYPERNEWVGHLGHLALSQLVTGHWRASRECITQCIAVDCEARVHPLLFDTHLAYLRGDSVESVRSKAEATVEAAAGIQFYEAFGRMYRGWALSHEHTSGLDEFREGKSRLLASHSQNSLSCVLGIEADALANQSLVDEGLAVIEDAFAFADSRAENFYRAELHRIEARLHTIADDKVEAQNSLSRAIEAAKSQKANWWALRSAAEMCRIFDSEQNRENLKQFVEDWPDGADTAPVEVG